MKKILLVLLLSFTVFLLYIWIHLPLFGNEWNKQTIYVGFLDALYGSSNDSTAYALWIDDDSTEGVLEVKHICDSIGIKPAFAVIADKMLPWVADSLVSWQEQGARIVLHGYRHERWKDWSAAQIHSDITKSLVRLAEQGFDTTHILKIIIPPHGCNTSTIRNVIRSRGYQMISGASLVNPDRHVFQLGRISITPNTNVAEIRILLEKAYKHNAFVIFGTHSSIPEWFSKEKTLEIIKIAKEIGFNFNPL